MSLQPRDMPMDSPQQDTRADCADTPRPSAGKNIVSFPPSAVGAEDERGTAVLQLVEEAATRLERTENHCAEIESHTRALADRAVGLLKSAAERIDSLETDCEKFNALIAEANARALIAEDALKRWDERFGAIEAQMNATEFRARSAEARASKSEEILRQVEEAIRWQLLARQRP